MALGSADWGVPRHAAGPTMTASVSLGTADSSSQPVSDGNQSSYASNHIAAMQDGVQRRRQVLQEAEHVRSLAGKQRQWNSPLSTSYQQISAQPHENRTATTTVNEADDEVSLSTPVASSFSTPQGPPTDLPVGYAVCPPTLSTTATAAQVTRPIPVRTNTLAPPASIVSRIPDDARSVNYVGPSRSASNATKTSNLVARHRSPSAASLAPPAPVVAAVSPRSPGSAISSPGAQPMDLTMPIWGRILDASNVKYDMYAASSLLNDTTRPSLMALRSQLVRLYPQLGTRTMADLNGANVLPINSECQVDEDALALPLWRAEDPGSVGGDSIACNFPSDAQGRVPSTAAGIYAAAEHVQPGELVGVYGPAWHRVAQEAQVYTLSTKQSKKVIDKLHQREQDLSLDVLSIQERAEVLITIHTERRKGHWHVRKPVHVGPEDQIALEMPQDIDPWSVTIDSSGIVARNKLRSNIELSVTRMNVSCPKCCGRDQEDEDAGPRGSDEEDAPPQQPPKVAESPCPVCQDYRAVEMSFVITVTVRVASFLPLPVPGALLAGTKQPHLRYGPEGADRGQERESFLKTHAIEGALNAAQKVGKQHYAKHDARLLFISATVRLTSSMTFNVKSNKAKCSRTFDRIEAWPAITAPPGADPASEPYNLEQHASVIDTTRDVARAQAVADIAARLPLTSPSVASSRMGNNGGYFSISRNTTPSPSHAQSSVSPTTEMRNLSPQPGVYPPTSGSHLTSKLSLFRSRSRLFSRAVSGGQSVQSNHRESMASQQSDPVGTSQSHGLAGLGINPARSGSMPSLHLPSTQGPVRPSPDERQTSYSTATSAPTMGMLVPDSSSSRQGPLKPHSSRSTQLGPPMQAQLIPPPSSEPTGSVLSTLKHSPRKGLRDLFTT